MRRKIFSSTLAAVIALGVVAATAGAVARWTDLSGGEAVFVVVLFVAAYAVFAFSGHPLDRD